MKLVGQLGDVSYNSSKYMNRPDNLRYLSNLGITVDYVLSQFMLFI